MITLRYQHLFHEQFIMCLQALKKTTFRDYKSPKNALNILKGIDASIEVSRKIYHKKLEPFFVKDADGNFVREKSALSEFKLADGKENEYREAFKEFLNTEFTLECEKINPDMILEARLSPTMVAVLEDIFDISNEKSA